MRRLCLYHTRPGRMERPGSRAALRRPLASYRDVWAARTSMMFDSRLAAGVARRSGCGCGCCSPLSHLALALGVLPRARRTGFSLATMARSEQGALKRTVSEGGSKGTVCMRKGWVAPQTEWGGGNHGSTHALSAVGEAPADDSGRFLSK